METSYDSQPFFQDTGIQYSPSENEEQDMKKEDEIGVQTEI